MTLNGYLICVKDYFKSKLLFLLPKKGRLVKKRVYKRGTSLQKTTYLLITILIMHLITLVNIIIFNGNWNGVVMAINTFLLVLAFGLVLPIKNKKKVND